MRSALARCLLRRPPQSPSRRAFCALSSLKTPVYEHVPWPEVRGSRPATTDRAPAATRERPSRPATSPSTLDKMKTQEMFQNIRDKGLDQPLDPALLADKQGKHPLAKPEMRFSVLDNGLRIVSIDKHGLTSNIGLFVHTGSRFEAPSDRGMSHMLEMLAFKACGNLSHLRIARALERLGATAGCVADREHLVYQVEVLRESVEQVMPLLAGNVRKPKLYDSDVTETAEKVPIAQQNLLMQPDLYMNELLLQAAFQHDTIGAPKFSGNEQNLSADNIRDFLRREFTPDSMVLVGVNVDHADFCQLAARQFADVPKPVETASSSENSRVGAAVPTYVGGEIRVPEAGDAAQGLCHLAIGFYTAGWNSDDLAPVTVLQMLLGGASSFSTGGPGKGMHSRLYTNVLNQCRFMESALCFNTLYSDAGLFGLYMTGEPQSGPSMAQVALREFSMLGKFSDEEVTRSKNALKSSVFMNLESRGLVMDDIGRQLLMSGKLATAQQFVDMIDAVTADDLVRVARNILASPPTVVAFGNGVDRVPPYEEVQKHFAIVHDMLSGAKSKL